MADLTKDVELRLAVITAIVAVVKDHAKLVGWDRDELLRYTEEFVESLTTKAVNIVVETKQYSDGLQPKYNN